MTNYRIIILLCALFCCGPLALAYQAPAAPVSGDKTGVMWYPSYQDGMKAAKANKRPALIKFGASWCGWCRKMDQEVFAQPPIATELGKFVCIKVDTEKDQGLALAYAVRSLPRVLVINTHDEIVGDWLGFRDADEFLALILDIQQYTHTAMGTTPVPKNIPTSSRTAQAQAQAELDPNALKEPSYLLGHKDPTLRRKAVEAWVARGREGLPTIIQLLGHDYLGVRIAAWAVIRQLKITDIQFDPWAPRLLRAQTVEKLRAKIGTERQGAVEQNNKN
jgi:thiol-disulfide isomerase/thioredoxin